MWPENMRFDGKVAIVTGAGQGIGETVARELAGAGVRVVVADVAPVGVERVVASLKANRQDALGIEVDVSVARSVEQMVQRTLAEWGAVHILMSCAGIAYRASAQDTEEAQWDRVMAVNLKGTFLCCQQCGRQMIAQGYGKIVNVASFGGRVGLYLRAAYCASKAGVISLTQTLAIEWGRYGINVNAVAPGYTETDMVKQSIALGTLTLEHIQKRCAFQRLGRPAEIADVMVFLASDASSFITGETVAVDGGWLANGSPLS